MKVLVKSTILGLCCTTAVACGKSDTELEGESSLSIVNGRKVTSKDTFARHLVGLITRDGRNFCSGTLVGKQLVLTAAHCVNGMKLNQFAVAFGPVSNPKVMKREYVRLIENAAQNREYIDLQGMVDDSELNKKGKFISDAAILKLKNPAPKGFYPAKILPPTVRFRPGRIMTMAGYGVTATPREGVKIESTKDLFDPEKIERDGGILRTVNVYYKGRNRMGEIELTARNGRFGACSGDSGGPVFIPARSKSGSLNYFLVGIAARSNCYNSASYTDVRAHSDWIKRARRFVNKK